MLCANLDPSGADERWHRGFFHEKACSVKANVVAACCVDPRPTRHASIRTLIGASLAPGAPSRQQRVLWVRDEGGNRPGEGNLSMNGRGLVVLANPTLHLFLM